MQKMKIYLLALCNFGLRLHLLGGGGRKQTGDLVTEMREVVKALELFSRLAPKDKKLILDLIDRELQSSQAAQESENAAPRSRTGTIQ